jgi:hypothetical protein
MLPGYDIPYEDYDYNEEVDGPDEEYYPEEWDNNDEE